MIPVEKVSNMWHLQKGVSKCLDFKNPPIDKIIERGESAEENSRKGLLPFISGSASLGKNSHFLQNSREKCTQLEHNDSNNDRAKTFEEKMAIFKENIAFCTNRVNWASY